MYAFDINDTIVEGDSQHNRGLKLNESFVTGLKTRLYPNQHIVFYTFGTDFEAFTRLMSDRGIEYPARTMRFVVWIKCQGKWQIWSRPLESASEVITSLGEANAYDKHDEDTFGNAVDEWLSIGHVLLKASYHNVVADNSVLSSFSRAESYTTGHRCKVLRSSRDIIAFDDNPQDWDIVRGRVHGVLTDETATTFKSYKAFAKRGFHHFPDDWDGSTLLNVGSHYKGRAYVDERVHGDGLVGQLAAYDSSRYVSTSSAPLHVTKWVEYSKKSIPNITSGLKRILPNVDKVLAIAANSDHGLDTTRIETLMCIGPS